MGLFDTFKKKDKPKEISKEKGGSISEEQKQEWKDDFHEKMTNSFKEISKKYEPMLTTSVGSKIAKELAPSPFFYHIIINDKYPDARKGSLYSPIIDTRGKKDKNDINIEKDIVRNPDGSIRQFAVFDFNSDIAKKYPELYFHARELVSREKYDAWAYTDEDGKPSYARRGFPDIPEWMLDDAEKCLEYYAAFIEAGRDTAPLMIKGFHKDVNPEIAYITAKFYMGEYGKFWDKETGTSENMERYIELMIKFKEHCLMVEAERQKKAETVQEETPELLQKERSEALEAALKEEPEIYKEYEENTESQFYKFMEERG